MSWKKFNGISEIELDNDKWKQWIMSNTLLFY